MPSLDTRIPLPFPARHTRTADACVINQPAWCLRGACSQYIRVHNIQAVRDLVYTETAITNWTRSARRASLMQQMGGRAQRDDRHDQGVDLC